MIEDKELGLIAADNSDEKFWIEFKKQRLENIKAHQRNIIVDEELLALAERKIIEVQQNGE